ncbi:MAG: hypothetical protein ACU833_04350 [Gammaproteobacteria bacterium]
MLSISEKKKFKRSVMSAAGKALVIPMILGGLSMKAQGSEETMPLHGDLERHRYPVTTSTPSAQSYFDQGLVLTYGFNHAEAAHSFRQAYQMDPNCALCYWGEALVLGPNINAPMDPAVAGKAYALVQKAMALADDASDKEKTLIAALSKRYALPAPEDRSELDEAYADAMRGAARHFPNDVVILSLFAEALMDLHPWDFWSKQGEPKPWTAEIVATLEHALAVDSENPLANHLYIHAMEASPFAEKALPSAQRLPFLVPGSGHLVHMPAHIYIRVGRYRDAILANQQAVKVDKRYLEHRHEESIYTLAYVPHNYHFLWAGAIKTGQKKLALKAAKQTAAHVDPKMMRKPGFSGTLQHFYTLPLFTRALFGQWKTILKAPEPDADLLYPRGVWHYARGLALLRTGHPGKARIELERLEKIAADPAIAQITVFDLNSVARLLRIGSEILAGELAAGRGGFDNAVAHLERAVELEDGLNYTEPKDWYLPPRQILGAVLLESGKASEAERVYRQDLKYHPQNGWSLFGLFQALRAQGKTVDAETVKRQFDDVWVDADITLTSSRF